ncbi:MAG TPA: hypothetical protein VL860_05065, partial [Planctomycetota bacterium]|nr:hypothetical protein [Planctomycetota bacterium]
PAGDYTPIVDVMSDVQVIKQENYNVVAHLTPGGSSLRARLVLDQVKDNNFQYVDFILDQGKRSLEYGISEGGVERPLARSAEVPVPAAPVAAAAGTAPGAPPASTQASGFDLSVRRRGFMTAVLVNGEIALTSLAPGAPPVNNEFDAKRMGFTGGYKILTGKGQFDRVEMTELESILFNDGFMRAETQSDNWQLVRGAEASFKVESLRNPLLSANAFVQLGYGKGSMLMIGRPEWDNYEYGVSLRGPWEASMGRVLCAIEPGKTNGDGIKFQTNAKGRKFDPDARYLVFEWKSNDHRPAGDPAITPENKDVVRRGGEMTLSWVSGDPDQPKVQILTQKTGGYLPNQWYRLRAEVAFGKVNLYVDNHLELSAEDASIAGGRIGLFCDVKEPPAGLYGANHEFSLNSMHQLLQYYGAWDDVEVRSTKATGTDYSGENNLWVGTHAGRPITPLILAEGTVLPAPTDKPAPTAPPASPAGLRISQGSQVVWGSPEWSNQVLSATVDLTATDRAGVFYNYVSPANYEAVVLDKTAQRVSFGRFHDGKWQELDAAAAKFTGVVAVSLKPQDRYLHINISSPGNDAAGAAGVDLHAYAFPGDARELPATDKKSNVQLNATATAGLAAQATADPHSSAKGRIGFFADQGVLAVIRFAVEPVQKDAVFTTSSAIFGHEETMSAWNSFSSEWSTQKDRETGSTVYWHQAFFPGDVAIKVHPVSFDKPGYEVALSVAKTAKKSLKNNGYVLMFTAGERKVDTMQKEPISHKLTLRLLRDNEPVVESACAVQGEIAQFTIRRAGPYLIGGINDQIVLCWRDPQPLEGNKVAYKTTGVTLADADTQITSNDIDDQRFEQAPTDWRTSLYGILEITNRWQCDPRWSFCSLFAPSIEASQIAAQGWPHPKRIACMWNKKEYSGDVVIELYCGTKMNKDRGGNYQYRRDMNIQLCSDGKSLSKGYTVMYGGMNNQGSYILRDGTPVFQDTAASAQINFAQGMHRHWFFIRIEKIGGTIKMMVDGNQKIITGTNEKPVTGWVDDKPLDGNRIAIWTYDNGLMIGRVRISGDGGKTWEEPIQEYSADEDCPIKN